jgi:hypothetical protein
MTAAGYRATAGIWIFARARDSQLSRVVRVTSGNSTIQCMRGAV